jgi:hypothetical protein
LHGAGLDQFAAYFGGLDLGETGLRGGEPSALFGCFGQRLGALMRLILQFAKAVKIDLHQFGCDTFWTERAKPAKSA